MAKQEGNGSSGCAAGSAHRVVHSAYERSNDDWIREEVAEVVDVLRTKNLAHANEVQPPAHYTDRFYTTYVKRFFDIVFSGAALVVTLPVNAVLGVVTYFDVGRPIVYAQDRTGKDLKPFKLYKFRNMTNETDENGELLPPDDRITKWGLFVRQHSLDELLNFWSVFKGDMSLIGPRPLPVAFTSRMTERHKMRYAVKPGLENPFMDLSLLDKYRFAHARFENDIDYVETISPMTDFKQAFRLISMVFGKRRTTGSTGTGSHFIGYDHDGLALSNSDVQDPEIYNREVLGIENTDACAIDDTSTGADTSVGSGTCSGSNAGTGPEDKGATS